MDFFRVVYTFHFLLIAQTLLLDSVLGSKTFFHEPAGRFSDGRLIIDFIAESLGLPYLSAYSVGSNFSHGANFATASSTIRPQNLSFFSGGYSPFSLDLQGARISLQDHKLLDRYGCLVPYNELSQKFNLELLEAVLQLRKELPLAAITYVDMYSAKYSLISQAKKLVGMDFTSPKQPVNGYSIRFRLA